MVVVMVIVVMVVVAVVHFLKHLLEISTRSLTTTGKGPLVGVEVLLVSGLSLLSPLSLPCSPCPQYWMA